MSEILVLGAGRQGSACAYDLAVREGFDVTLADADRSCAERTAASIPGNRTTAVELDARDRQTTRALMARHTAVVSAVPYFLNLDLARDAVEAGAHFTDMGGNTDIVMRELELDEAARERGVSVVPDLGLAPGLANLLAAHAIESFDEVEEVRIRVGGLPTEPQPPLGYTLLFSLHGLINEYVGDAIVLRDGEIAKVPCFDEVEQLEVPGVGKLEAFPTQGGISTMPYTYRGRVREMDYRTLRYPGHYERMKTIIDLGLLDEKLVDVPGGQVRPRDVFAACAEPHLTQVGMRDLVIVRVTVRGRARGEERTDLQEIIDHYDDATKHSAMMRTTAYPTAIVAAMQARGTIEPGARPPELAVPTWPFREALAAREIHIRRA